MVRRVISQNLFLSLIVPVYNTPIEHMRRCFLSLANQSCKDFELIVVDGGSVVDVANFLDELPTLFNYIKVEHISHCGVSATRNRGLELASSSYVAFADSDDEYSLDFVKEAKEYVEKYAPDIVYGTITFVPTVNEIQDDSKVHYFDKLDEIREVYKALLDIPKNGWGLRVFRSQCSRVYRYSLASQVRFDENVSCGEDGLFNRKCLRQAKSVLMVPNSWYIYYANDYSVTHQKKETFFQMHKHYYDAFIDINRMEDIEMRKLLLVPQYKSFFAVMRCDVIGNEVNEKRTKKRSKSQCEMGRIIDETLSHPYFASAFEGLRGSRAIGFVDRVFVYLVNHRMYRLLIFCCRIGIEFRNIIRRIQGRERF